MTVPRLPHGECLPRRSVWPGTVRASLIGIGLCLALANSACIHPETRTMKTGDGIISRPSKYSVPETLDRVETRLRERGIRIFARIDHSGEAAAAGLAMPPTQLLIFGNPKGGTPLMVAAPTAAIDLPLKALAWQDAEGTVWLSYNDPSYLARRFGFTDEQIKTIVPLAAVIEPAAD